MAISHSTDARTAATDGVTATLGTNARLKFHPTGATLATPGTVLANLALSAGANGGFSTGSPTATAGAITSDTNTAAGTVAAATLQTSGGVAKILCAVAASGSDINLSNGLTLASGDTLSCSSLTYTALSQ